MSATTSVPAGTFKVDTVHSTAEFAVKHLGINTFRTGFDEIDASLVDGVLTGKVPVASIRIPNPDFKGHVLSAEFFDAENTPEITFTSTAFDIAADGAATVTGDLTIRGTTQQVTGNGTLAGPVVGLGGQPVISIELEAIIDRHAFGLNWNADLPGGGKALAEQVKLVLHLELVGSEA